MVFRFKCLEFLSSATEARNRRSNQSSCESYYSAHADFVVSSSVRPNDIEVFTYLALEQATGNFSRSSKIGEGEFGLIYKAVIQYPNRKLEVVVKRLNERHIKGHKEWVTEMNVLGVVKHPNLVKLVGCCVEDNEREHQRLLVYEYMPNRSVEYHLSTSSEAPLSWTMRLKLAQDVARGLAYLHEGMAFQIIFEGFKSSSILLDDQWNAKLSYFGLARLSPDAVVGSTGYAAPECRHTGRLTAKSDVWSYGVFLYELITGRCPLDRNRPKNERKLLEWVKPYVGSKKFQLIVDPRLEGKYSLRSAQKLAIIANRCLSRNPKSRPKMSKVLEKLDQLTGVPSQ